MAYEPSRWSRTRRRAAAAGCAVLLVAAASAQSTRLATGPESRRSAVPETVMLFFVDRIEENGSVWPYDRYTERSEESWVAQQISELLQDAGEGAPPLEIIVSEHHKVLRRIHEDFARLSDADLATVREIATEQGAQYHLVGYAHCIGPTADDRHVPGQRQWSWDAFAKARMFRTDTGKQIATRDAKGLAINVNQDAGRIDALRQVGNLLAPKLRDAISAGLGRESTRRTVTVTVLDATPTQALAIKQALRRIAGDQVNMQTANGVATARFHHVDPADEIAARIYAERFDGFSLELMEARDDAIRFKVVCARGVRPGAGP